MSRPSSPSQSTSSHGGRGLSPLVVRTLAKAWENKIFSEAAATAFWETLSLPPLLLGLLGSLGFVGYWFGPAVVDAAHANILSVAHTVFSANVANEIISPTVSDILTQGRTDIVSVGFLLSLWAGSSALASLVDSITVAYDQYLVRHSVWQRIVALLLYLVGLVLAVIGLPIIALGPDWLSTLFPPRLHQGVAGLIHTLYYPAIGVALVLALATLYKVALPRKLPWHRGLPGALLAMLVFLCASAGLRLYIVWVTSTGYTYGALAAPIAFLLFAFSIAFAIIIGAEFNSAIQELWPAPMTRAERRRWRRLEMRRAAQRLCTEQGYQGVDQPRHHDNAQEGEDTPGHPPGDSTEPGNGTARRTGHAVGERGYSSPPPGGIDS